MNENEKTPVTPPADNCAICEATAASAKIKGLSGLEYDICAFCESVVRRAEIDSWRKIFRSIENGQLP